MYTGRRATVPAAITSDYNDSGSAEQKQSLNRLIAMELKTSVESFQPSNQNGEALFKLIRTPAGVGIHVESGAKFKCKHGMRFASIESPTLNVAEDSIIDGVFNTWNDTEMRFRYLIPHCGTFYTWTVNEGKYGSNAES